MTETTVGREPVQIVELVQPRCANIYGTAPCTASGSADAKSYNTRATCQDTANYRGNPEATLGAADQTYASGDIVDPADFDRTADFFFAVDLRFGATASGCIWELGGSGDGAYLGVTSGNLVLRFGNGGSADPANCAKVSVAVTPYLNRALTLYGAIDMATHTASLWAWDAKDRSLALVGQDTAASTFANWAGTNDGAVGRSESLFPVGEDATDFSGTITAFRAWDATSAPAMGDDFRLRLFFAKGTVADMQISGADYIIPSLVSVSTSPTRINLAGANPDAQGLGNRALCRITFQDHAHSDRVVDPYVEGRSWNPLDRERGSFWSRWVVRNKYRQNMLIRVYEGYAGQALSAMRTRSYFLQSLQGPDSAGRVTIEGKDILARIEGRKAQAPLASPGVLYAAIDAAVTTFEVAGALEAEYTATGTLRIGSEVMTYTGRATSANGVTFTGVTRGTDGTTAAQHAVNAGVQQCLRYTEEPLNDVLFDLLTVYGGVDAAYCNTAGWQEEFDNYRSFYRLTTLITTPTSVQSLVSELQEQCAVYVWWDERSSLVEMKAIRGIDEEPRTITDANHIIEGSFALTEKPRERTSQVWISYQPLDPTRSLTDETNYQTTFILAYPDTETDDLFGEPSIRKIFARWLPTDALAQTTASIIGTRYVDVPSECVFRADAKDRDLWVGDNFFISHYLDRDEFGARRIRQWTIVSAEEVVPGEQIEYVCEDTTLYGTIHFIMANDAVDYPGYDSAPFRNCYIGDVNGLLSDGERAGKIS